MAHPIEVNAITFESADGPVLSATWTYVDDLIPDSKVRELAELWFAALTALVDHVADGDLTADVLPVLPAQEGFLFHSMLAEQEVDVYVGQLVLTLAGAEPVTGRIVRAGAEDLTLTIPAVKKVPARDETYAYAGIDRADVQVEFSRKDPADTAPSTDAHDHHDDADDADASGDKEN